MGFVFYDTETTGINPEFDQVLQIAAIRTTEDLQEIDRFEIRCRLLPWIIPSPIALRITGLSPREITDSAIPSHYAAMRKLHRVFESWSPSTFIGYNSVSFDEEFLRRGFWQTLQSPWLTVTNGNTRLDLLPIVQTASLFSPHVLRWPADNEGKRRFNLDRLAPENGFAHGNAHDAMADTEAALHIARMLATRSPKLWNAAVSRRSRRDVETMLLSPEPILCVEFKGPISWSFRRVLGQNPVNSSAILAARLDANWEIISRGSDGDIRAALTQADRPVRSLPVNRSPMIFSRGEAATLWGISPAVFAQRQFHFLSTNRKFVTRLIDLWQSVQNTPRAACHLEQLFYQGFPSQTDQKNAEAFHDRDWSGRTLLLQTFSDDPLRRWGQRLIYAEAPSALPEMDRQRLESAIAARLLVDADDQFLWRTVPAARRELASFEATEQFVKEFDEFLKEVELRFSRAVAVTSHSDPM